MPESDLPEGWRQATVADVVDPARRVTYGIVQPGPRQREEVGVPMIRGQDYSDGAVATERLYHVLPSIAASYSRSTVEGGDLLLSIVGYVGTAAQVPDELTGANLTQTTARLAIAPGHLARYVLHYLRSNPFREEVKRFTKGSAQPGLNLADVEVMKLALPPLPEQRRIAEILDTLDDLILSTEQLIAKLKQLKQGLLHDLLTRGIDENGELRDPERHPEQFKDSPLGRIPKVWDAGRAATWCDRLTVGVVTGATHAYAEAGIPFIRSQNVKPNFIDDNEMLFITQAFNQLQGKSILRTGDVVIVRTGYPGTAAVVPQELDGANCFSLVIASPGPKLRPQFLAQYMNSPMCKAEIARMQFGSAQHNFNVGEMRRLPMALPPIAEQDGVLRRVHVADEGLAREQDNLAKMRAIKSGLMEDLLTGRVRVSDLEDSA